MSTRLQRSRSRLALASVVLFVLVPALRASERNPVIVHEWGTFTSLQDEKGKAIGGINVDDEPVPFFVCQYANRMVVREHSAEEQNFGLPPYQADGGKGWTVGDPNVTMRLETPVIYIYPPEGRSPQSVPPLDIHVDFHGGVLSQFYPYAKTNGSDGDEGTPYLRDPHVTEETVTGLTWSGVKLGVSGKPFASRNAEEKDAPWIRGAMVETTDKVWTTPRETRAPLLGVDFTQKDYAHPGKTCEYSEAEHFLFYRGVGHLESPLRLVHQKENDFYPVIDTFFGAPLSPAVKKEAADMNFDDGWFVKILPDGRCAYRPATSPKLSGNSFVMEKKWSAIFTDADFSAGNLSKLKTEMQKTLVQHGLYKDEASAMLRTWELSYFKSPGLRFFYTVPSEWVDRILPLKVTGAPVKITRVMIGRIELVSNTQRATLARLAAGPCPDLQPVKVAAAKALETGYTQAEKDAFYSGDRPLRELGIAIPPLVQDYLDLGRFRDALIVHEQEKSPSPALAEFISKNRIGPPATASIASPAIGVAASNPVR